MKTRSFDPVARAYTDNVSPYRFSQFLALIHELRLKGDETVLDIGCGAGILSTEAARRLRKGRLIGIDISDNMVKLAGQTAARTGLGNIQFRAGNGLDLAFKDATFDVVMSSNAFPWVPDRARFLAEIYRVLKPGGRLGLVSLSNACYREFAVAFKAVATAHPELLPQRNPLELAGGKLHTLNELERLVRRTGFRLGKRFKFSTEEPVTTEEYLQRVNSIVNEGYLDHLKTSAARKRIRNALQRELTNRNGTLKITESSLFVLATKVA